jgi:putative spermidine/putrescine transport system permease protein
MSEKLRNGRGRPLCSNAARLSRLCLPGMIVTLFLPYGLLLWLSMGSGWSYPNLGPDRLDMQPWIVFATDGEGLWRSVATSGLLGCSVATLSTLLGMTVGRHVHTQRGFWMFLAYLPFASSPVIIGICLLDMFIRLGLASTILGVFLIQAVFASAFAVILFSELWGADIRRLEQVVLTLGGSRWHAWRHGTWPRLWKLAVVCWLQTFLFSWLDYALVSTIGGGVVPSLTLSVIAYIREASVNQAAQASIVLIVPPIASMLVVALLMRHRLAGGVSHGQP